MSFSDDYVRLVLNENFEDAKALLLEPLTAVHYAHLVMLAERDIISRDDAHRIRGALDQLDLPAIRRAVYDGSCEDLFFYLDQQISAKVGPDVAGRLHTARSRNDIDMTMYRMVLREHLLRLLEATIALRRSSIDLATNHRGTIFPAHTHTQPAQPTTLAHYLLAVIEERERDMPRLAAAYARTNQNPLGACAITGTGFQIDRDRTSDLLGFEAPTGNTYGSIATVDYLVESAGAAAVTLVGVGRFVQDLLLWCTSEVGYVRLPDGLVQASSIMPQKRNPVALEHARSLLSKALGQTNAIPATVHNTPFGDIVDTEDDLQPLVASAFKDATRGVSLVAVALAGAEFDVTKMAARAREGWVTLTELADTLVRDHGLSFKIAHGIAARLVRERQTDRAASLGDIVARASHALAGREIRLGDVELERLLSPEHFIAVRRAPGGPAPEATAAALETSAARLSADEASLEKLRDSLAEAKKKLSEAVGSL